MFFFSKQFGKIQKMSNFGEYSSRGQFGASGGGKWIIKTLLSY